MTFTVDQSPEQDEEARAHARAVRERRKARGRANVYFQLRAAVHAGGVTRQQVCQIFEAVPDAGKMVGLVSRKGFKKLLQANECFQLSYEQIGTVQPLTSVPAHQHSLGSNFDLAHVF